MSSGTVDQCRRDADGRLPSGDILYLYFGPPGINADSFALTTDQNPLPVRAARNTGTSTFREQSYTALNGNKLRDETDRARFKLIRHSGAISCLSESCTALCSVHDLLRYARID